MKDNRPIAACSAMDDWGRFANAIFQYAFLRLYAKRNNFKVQTPSWIGQFLFGHNDPPIASNLSSIYETFDARIYDGTDSNLAHLTQGNINMYGYFQYHTKFYLPYKNFFCSLFQPIPNVQMIVEKSINALRLKGNTIIGFHLRRGDFEIIKEREIGAECFFIAPCKWYLNWLDENWDRFDKPVLFIASDSLRKIIGDFSKYNPITNKSLNISFKEAPFYPDFYTLSQCDITCISNSSYSYAASMLNKKGTEFYRPKLTLKKLISYEPWNAYPLLRGDDL